METAHSGSVGGKPLDRDLVSAVLKKVPDRPLSCLSDVALLYGAASQYRGLVGDIPETVVQEKLPLFDTVSDGEVVNQPNSILAVNVDLTGDEPSLGDPPVTFDQYDDETKFKLGFVKKANATTGIHHSLTMWASGNSIEDIAGGDYFSRFVRGRFEKWPKFSGVNELISSSSDGEPLKAIRDLGQDEDFLSEACSAVKRHAPVEELTGFVTVRVKTEPDGEYLYPGEVPVFCEAAEKRQLLKFSEEGISISSGLQGTGAGYISGEKTTVLGGTPGLNSQYGKKKVDVFQGISEETAWRTRPLDEEYAVALKNANDAIEPFHVVVDGIRSYYLPYPAFTQVDEDVFERFYTDVYRPLVEAAESDEQDDDSSVFIPRLVNVLLGEDVVTVEDTETEGITVDNPPLGPDELDALIQDEDTGEEYPMRLYSVVHNAASDPSRTFSESENISFSVLGELAQAYGSVRATIQEENLWNSDWLWDSNMFVPVDSTEVVESVFNCTLFFPLTAPNPNPKNTNGEEGLESSLATWYSSILRNNSISTEELLEHYLNRIRRQLRNEGQQNDIGPMPYVVAQYEQLRVFEQCNLLDTEIIGATNTQKLMTNVTDSDFGRDEKLAEVLDTHQLLSEENPGQRAAFLLGGLVGRLSSYQSFQGVSQTVRDSYSVESLTTSTFETVMSEVFNKNEQYISSTHELSPSYNSRYISNLREVLLTNPPETWDITNRRLQWVYQLGVSYGREDTVSEQQD